MARERWWADGWELTQGIVRDVEKREGLYRAASFRGGNVEVPARHGELWRAKKLSAGGFVLNVWLGADDRPTVEAYYDQFLRAVGVGRSDLVLFRRRLANGTERTCLGEVMSTIDPQPIGQLGMRMAVEVRVPSGTWKAGTAPTGVSAVGAMPSVVTLSNLEGSTGPVEDLVIRINGPVSRPSLQDITGGKARDRFTYDAFIAAGAYVEVDCGTWSAIGSGLNAFSIARCLYTGDRFLTVAPAPPGSSPRISVTGANTTTATSVTFTGRPTYMA